MKLPKIGTEVGIYCGVDRNGRYCQVASSADVVRRAVVLAYQLDFGAVVIKNERHPRGRWGLRMEVHVQVRLKRKPIRGSALRHIDWAHINCIPKYRGITPIMEEAMARSLIETARKDRE